MVDTVTLAFDKADQYRMPAMILADGLLGQMMEPVTFPEPRTTLPDKSDWAANGHGNKREHHIINSLYLDAPLLEAKVQERFKRYAIIEETETDAELYCCDDAEIVVTAYGASARVSKSAVTAARRKGIKASEALDLATARFLRRFARMEELARQQGKDFPDLSLDEKDELWNAAKEEEKAAH